MKSFRCSYCGQEINFTDSPPGDCPNCLSPVDTDDFINTEADRNHNNTIENETQNRTPDPQKPSGLRLIYQKTGERIEIDHNEKIIIGRENTGREILFKIPQISRSHCSILFKDDCYFISDLDSTNGTFIGTKKIDCKINPEQAIKNNELIYLGREPFLVQIKYENSRKDQSEKYGKLQFDIINPGKVSSPASSRTETESNRPSNAKNKDRPATINEKQNNIEPANKSINEEPVKYECQNCRSFWSETREFTCPKCNTYNV